MERIEKTFDVRCPVHIVYNQWTQFEEFPRFMAGVKEVRQLDDTHVHWRAEIWGKDKEWDAEITEQMPDQRISWQSTSGAVNAGTVRFEPLGPELTRVQLILAYEPAGALESIGDAVGLLGARVQKSVENFKEFIEERGAETGGWRGEVRGGQAQPLTGDDGARIGAAGGERVPGGGTGTPPGDVSDVGRTGPGGGERAPGGGVRLGTSIGDTGKNSDSGAPAREWPLRSDQRK